MDKSNRNSVLKTAEAQFLKYGIRAISVDDICAEIHMSKKTFYQEFSSKEQLVSVIYEHLLDTKNQFFKTQKTLETGINVIEALFYYRLPEYRAVQKKRERFLYDLLKYYPDIHKKSLDKHAAIIKHSMAVYLKKGIEQGLFRKDLDVKFATSFLLSWDSTINKNVIDMNKADRENYVSLVMDSFLRVVCNQQGWDYYQQNHVNK